MIYVLNKLKQEHAERVHCGVRIANSPRENSNVVEIEAVRVFDWRTVSVRVARSGVKESRRIS